MQHRIFTTTALIFSMTAWSGYAQAARGNEPYPIEKFTRSLASYYVALEKCSDQSDQASQADMARIREYMAQIYPYGTPQWALPKVAERITDETTCNYLLYDRVTSYRQARRDYASAYPKEATPPQFHIRRPLKLNFRDRAVFDAQERKRIEFDW